jgi:hypothetical protein
VVIVKHYFYLFGLIVCLALTACTKVSRQIQDSANVTVGGYPAARANNPALEQPPVVDLGYYKSVQTRPHQRSDIAIAVAASGGGYRAANLTLGVLMGFEKMHSSGLKGNLLQEVDYYSSVSGSGFGVGYYLTKLHNYFLNYNSTATFSLQNTVNQMLAKDSENPLRMDLTEHLFFGDDRGWRLESKLNTDLLDGLRLGDIYIPKISHDNVQLPYWSSNATIYQNAAIFPFSPDIIDRYRVTGYFHDGRQYTFSAPLKSPWYGTTLPVSVGLTASASVPFATPATTLITKGCGAQQCYLQLLDGGLADNLGVYTALSFLLQDKSRIKVLILVDAYKGDTQPYSQMKVPPDNIPLLMRVMTVGTDSNREHIKPNIRYVGRDLLCGSGATNVVVIYLDLTNYPLAQRVGTQLSMTSENQKLLIKIGQDLVANNPTIKTLLAQLERRSLTLGKCPRYQ